VPDIKVSVILPIYNEEKYLSYCLKTICNQTLKEIEIICVDDGSTDKSLDILEKFQLKDSRIIIIKQQNGGAGTARNNGLHKARGQYVSFLDSDDFFEPDMLELAYQKCEKFSADFCVFRSNRYYDQSKVFEEIPWTIKQRFIPNKEVFSSADVSQYIFQIFNGWAWDKLYRKSFILKTGLLFQNLRTTNDAYFVFMANTEAKQIVILDKVLAHHRVEMTNSLSVTREKSWDCSFQAIMAIENALKNRKTMDMFRQSFINWAIHFILWNIMTLKGEEKKIYTREAKEHYFPILEIKSYPKEYFYSKSEYTHYQSIINNKNREVFYLIKCGIHYLKINGIIKTIYKIISFLRFK
jgi:glycosyltransferase involved in cell wall biosynthesis